VYLPEEGSLVQEGDTAIVFDTKQVESRLDESNKELEKTEAELREVRLSNTQNIAEIQTGIESLQIQKNIILTQLERARYNSALEQKEVELELAKVDLSNIRENQNLESQFVLNRNAENEIQLRIQQIKTTIEMNRRMISDMYITAPKSGLVIYLNQGGGRRRGRGEKTRLGDSVMPRTAILSIPDLGSMRAVIDLNEVDYPYIRVGQRAKIVVEAYPDTVFSGEVVYVSRIVDYDEQVIIKTYTVEVNIHSKEDFRLKPGLSAQVTIFTDSLTNAFSIPTWCLFNVDGIFCVKDNREEQIPVKVMGWSDGIAYVEGALATDLKLQANTNIPDF
jgi:multidrug resistance efflux pump